DFIREDWLTLVRLYGSSDTQTLPRIPLADLQTVLVLDVEPGIYRVVAQAWTRKHHPTAGGVLDSVRVESGKITVLRAQRLTGPFVAEPEVPLFHSASQTWTLRSADQLPDFVSEIVRQTVKG
ncbi:hypothetical protein KJ815_05800, partial [bacterium]|nr:hypothetical protein [bacterium]